MDKNQPIANELAIVSFKLGFHGRLLATLSTTRSKAIHKMDIPSFDWPVSPFPALKFPFALYEKENLEEEARCLDAFENILKTSKKRIAGAIIEPVLSEGGDLHASPHFFLGVQKLCK